MSERAVEAARAEYDHAARVVRRMVNYDGTVDPDTEEWFGRSLIAYMMAVESLPRKPDDPQDAAMWKLAGRALAIDADASYLSL